MSEHKIGVQTFTVRKHIKSPESLRKTLMKLHKLGFTNFELARIKYNAQTLKVLRELKEELGLTYSTTQIPMNKIKSNFEFLMQFSNQLDIKYIEVSVIPLKNFFKKKVGILDLALELNQLGQKTQEHGVSLLYHHHNFELIKFEGKMSIEYLLENTDSKYVNFVADTYWLAKSGVSPYEFVANHQDRIKGVHIKDVLLVNQLLSFKYTDTTVGQGSVNFKQIINMDIDFFSIEIDTQNPFADLKSSLEHLTKLKK